MSGANTLILDEPTNHMDIESKEVFEEALQEFEGTAIIVSHDRYFLQKIPTRILELTPDGVVEYLGKYDYYLERKALEAEERRRKREIEGLEREIESIEERIAEIEREMQLPENLTDFGKLSGLSSEMTELKEKEDAAYTKWEELQYN